MDESGKQSSWKPKTGRRTKLTPELIHEIAARLAGGLYFETACRLCSVDPATGYRWLARARQVHKTLAEDEEPSAPEDILFCEFCEAVMNARSEAEARSVLALREAGKTDWRAHAWYLERTRPDFYAPKERHANEFARLTDEQLVAEATRLFGEDFSSAVAAALGIGPQDDNDNT